eukprot:GHVR01038987.1.p1 GENE.GHVR01038987.1~~GHVR01038987.1.p1  ORF type:complete len:259 (-),score=30.43 GHVR01038987.1:131-907(-)
MTLLFNIIVSFALLGQRTSILAILCCSVVVIGFVAGALDKASLSNRGMILGLLSSLFQALYSSTNKLILPYCNNNSNTLLSYTQFWAMILFIPAIWFFDEWRVWGAMPWLPTHPEFLSKWSPLVLSGSLAVLLNISALLLLNLSNPVTSNMVGMLKSCIQTVIGFFVLGGQPTPENVFGVISTIFGTFLYSLVTFLEGLFVRKNLRKEFLVEQAGEEEENPKEAYLAEVFSMDNYASNRGSLDSTRPTRRVTILSPSK